MVELRDVSLRFHHHERKLLSSVSLTVEQGSCVGLTGPSGGGKTLIGLIAAGVIPDLIHADIGGSVRRLSVKESRRTPSAIVFQDPSFQLLSKTVRDELLYTPRKLGWPEEEIRRDFKEIVNGLDIGRLLDRNPRELSMGEVQRAAVGVALIQRPHVIVLDEPTQYLDSFHVSRTLEFVDGWNRRHRAAILLIEHHVNLLKRFCDRTFHVENGTLTSADLHDPVFPVNGLPVHRTDCVCSELRGVTFRYTPERPVLKGVSLAVSRGESVALLGPNGSGKTTLAKLMCGLYEPAEGEVTLFGKHRMNGSWFRDIGYLMQNPDRQIFASSVQDECSFGPSNFGVPHDVYEEAISGYLKAFRLDGFERREPFSLSYGEKRRMNVVGVMSYDPSVLIFDEPTSGLDFNGQRILLEHVKRWNAAGKTVIVITHDLAFARAVCRRAVLIDDGRIVRDTPMNELLDDDVIALYSP